MTVEWPALRAVIANCLGLSTRRIRKSAQVGYPEEWDSLRHLMLLLAIEEEFGTSLTAEDFGRLTSATVILGWLNE